jgi:hypothetical protein
MSKSKHTVSPAAILQIVHEERLGGNHRIVVIRGTGPDAGMWYPYEQVASHSSGLHGATNHWAGILPVGIFRATSVSHTVL